MEKYIEVLKFLKLPPHFTLRRFFFLNSTFLIFQVFVVLIMLNLLISLMTATFARIQQNADMEWKFIRAATWIHYFEDRYYTLTPI